jgi:hypothetical protein
MLLHVVVEQAEVEERAIKNRSYIDQWQEIVAQHGKAMVPRKGLEPSRP